LSSAAETAVAMAHLAFAPAAAQRVNGLAQQRFRVEV